MTWIIGAIPWGGYGVLISDIQVTLSNGTTHDVLKKTYQIGEFSAAGFAGSVAIGFQLMEKLNEFLCPPLGDENYVPDVKDFANVWQKEAHAIFENADSKEQKLGSEMLIVGVFFIKENQELEICMIKFCAPEYKPLICRRKKRTILSSVGSGSAVARYKKTLRELSSRFTLSDLNELRMPGLNGQSLLHRISQTVISNPCKGIGRNLHLYGVSAQGCWLTKNNQRIWPPEAEPIVIQMPPVATNMKELNEMLRKLPTAGARC